MALPKKKSRPITVNDNDYRYAISTTQIDDNWNFRLNLTVQSAKGEGSILGGIGDLLDGDNRF